MKISKLSVFLLTAALLGSSAVFAGEVNKTTLKLYETTTVEGKALQPGDYKVTWQGSGPDVQVTIQQGKETVATFQAHVTEQAARNAGDAYGSSANAGGSRALTAIYPGGKRIALEIGQQSNATAAN
ncbi:MAG TPA: hypothetical protein VKB48_16810 [Candidatus Acidoferrum sp.]|nr:hypothetical protein [Candidatus Acidoferrum sp.]